MNKAMTLGLVGLLTFSTSFGAEAIQDKRLKKVYTEDAPALKWIDDDEWTTCARNIIAELEEVETDGLDEDDYAPLLAKLKMLDLSDDAQRQEADEILTVAILDYISDMKGERLNPRKVDKQLYYRQVNIDETQLLQEYLAQDSRSCGWVQTLAPQRHEYKHMKDLLALYRMKKANGTWPILPRGTKVKKGDTGPKVQQLKDLLVAQGLLSPDLQMGTTFNEPVEQAVKMYQKLHGLEVDGKVGPATAKAMNTPIGDLIKKIIVSMERQRWLPEQMGDRYLQVNIAGFELKAVNGGQTQFTMPVITGKHYRETPNFNAPMTEIKFNPSWHVPYSIAVKDKLPKLQNNPNAFAGRGYNFYDSSTGERVDPSSVNWAAYGQGHFPYRIRQSPGAGNALGKIRFTIKSPFAIYLHGTPKQKLFKKAKRSFSSGCIRVEAPSKLAQFAFDDQSKWNLDRINREAAGTRTKKVKLKQELPVYITYFTVWEDQKGMTHFVPDVYGQDKQIWDALQNHKRRYKL